MSFDLALLLFVPGDRPDRFAKALASGASGAILDLEDAVALDAKDAARERVRAFLDEAEDLSRVAVRINACDSEAGARDLAMLAGARRVGAVLVPKVEDTEDLAAVGAALGDVPQIALLETARGIVCCDAIARAPRLIALAFGPYDLAADLGGDADADLLLPHRARVLVAARAAGRAAIDGPTREFGDPAVVRREAMQARRLGFDGKLTIHPAQIAPVRAAFAPSADEVAQARRVVAAAALGSPAVLDGAMIDAPILRAAERALHRAGQTPSP